MQEKDYDMAYVCFNESEVFMNMRIEDERIRIEDGQAALTDIKIDQFILACRQFQKGLTNLEMLRKANSNRRLLSDSDTSLAFDEDDEGHAGDISRSQRLLLNSLTAPMFRSRRNTHDTLLIN